MRFFAVLAYVFHLLRNGAIIMCCTIGVDHLIGGGTLFHDPLPTFVTFVIIAIVSAIVSWVSLFMYVKMAKRTLSLEYSLAELLSKKSDDYPKSRGIISNIRNRIGEE